MDDLCKRFNTSVNGLTNEQAKENLAKYGPNNGKDMPECIMVKREGELKYVMSEEVTLGDILHLNPANDPRIHADVRIIDIMEAPFYVESFFSTKIAQISSKR